MAVTPVKKKLFVCGYARHGKDTFAEMVCRVVPEISFVSSSKFVAERAVWPELSELYGYRTVDECYEDRFNHREEWHRLISEYNRGDLGRLARELFKVHDIYVGIRCGRELADAREDSDLILWVDRSDFLPPEPEDSNTVTPDMCDLIVDNNGTLQHLERRATRFAKAFYHA